MMDLLYGFQVAQALFVVARLDVATLLEAGPRPVVGDTARRVPLAPLRCA